VACDDGHRKSSESCEEVVQPLSPQSDDGT
jgi:hypothetical protein